MYQQFYQCFTLYCICFYVCDFSKAVILFQLTLKVWRLIIVLSLSVIVFGMSRKDIHFIITCHSGILNSDWTIAASCAQILLYMDIKQYPWKQNFYTAFVCNLNIRRIVQDPSCDTYYIKGRKVNQGVYHVFSRQWNVWVWGADMEIKICLPTTALKERGVSNKQCCRKQRNPFVWS